MRQDKSNVPKRISPAKDQQQGRKIKDRLSLAIGENGTPKSEASVKPKSKLLPVTATQVAEQMQEEADQRKMKIMEVGNSRINFINEIADILRGYDSLVAVPVQTIVDAYKDKLHLTATEIKKMWKDLHGIKETKDIETGEQDIESYFADTEPCQYDVVPRELLKKIVGYLRKYYFFNEEIAEEQIYTCALWIMDTWCVESLDFATYLMLTSPEKGCGKSSLVGILQRLARKSFVSTNIGVAALFRLVHRFKPTLFLDESDELLKSKDDVLGMLNSGIERGNKVVRCNKDDNNKLELYDTFGFKVIAGIATNFIKDTLTSRCIVLELQRKPKNIELAKLRRKGKGEDWQVVKAECARFAQDCREWLIKHEPQFPKELDDRNRDIWESLFSIADYIDYKDDSQEASDIYPFIGSDSQKSLGSFMRKASLKLSNTENEPLSTGKELLTNIKAILEANEYIKYIQSQTLRDELVRNSEWMWATYSNGKAIDCRTIKALLAPYKIVPKRTKNCVTYSVQDFEKAFKVYGISTSN